MGLKSIIQPRLLPYLLGEPRLRAARAKHEAQRVRSGRPHRVQVFHDPADPYSQLLMTVLPEFRARYDVEVEVLEVGAPSASANPEAARLRDYAKDDAAALARRAGVDFTYEPRPHAVDTADADAQLAMLGHYQGGMIHYAGEWYWGLDRLHYLEERLAELGAKRDGAPDGPIHAPPTVPSGSGDSGATIHWYASFRSPYTAIVRDRIAELAERYGAELRLRPVLPMVMRGLPVPTAKRRYILPDTAREARRHAVAFGRVSDPVGRPVEMAYSLIPHARERGRDVAYARAWLTAVWSEGVDAGKPRNLRRIAEHAGLDWAEAREHLGTDGWRADVEANRVEMLERGIWGVPSFRVDDEIVWGQDRLWRVEEMLAKTVG